MGKKNKHKKNISIPEPIIPEEKRIKFSFRFYDRSQDCYCISNWEKDKIAKDTFYIVWFDVNHEILPTLKKHTYIVYPLSRQ